MPSHRKRYPTAWSSWQWSDEYQKEYRYCKVADTGNEAQDYQYEYRDAPAATPRDIQYAYRDVPAATSAADLNTIPESPAPQEDYATNYTYSASIQDVTSSLAQASLGYTAGNTANYNHRHIRTRYPDRSAEPLNPNFKLQASSEFQFGRVFKILWTEPVGTTGTDITKVKNTKHGEEAYSSIRRFVIVSSHEGHSLCLPILTYRGQGTLKKGVKPRDHCIIYTSSKAEPLRHEEVINKSIRMIPDNPREKLDPASRMNYAKIYTVEHNVKVYFIGRIAPKYEQQVVIDYNRIHEPLADRPTYTENSEETFAYAQGGTSWPQSNYEPTMPRSSGYTVSYQQSIPAPSDGPEQEQAYPDVPDAQPEAQAHHHFDPSLYDKD